MRKGTKQLMRGLKHSRVVGKWNGETRSEMAKSLSHIKKFHGGGKKARNVFKNYVK